MGDDNKSWSIDVDTLKNLGVILGVVSTLFGVINFGTNKISLYDGYAARLAKLEARDQAIASLSDNDKAMAFQLESQKSDISTLKTRVETMSTDVIQLRLNIERIRALLENVK